MEIKFKKGDLILTEGMPGNEAYFINSGKVQVFQTRNGEKVELAVLGKDQIFGEMSMIDDRPRSASISALEDTTLTRIDPREFNELIHSDPELLQIFLKSIFERLRHMDQAIIDLTIGMAAESYAEGRVFISGLTSEAGAALGEKEFEVAKFPFKVGRKTENCDNDIFANNDLYLEDKKPFNVSRNHFSIQKKLDKFLVIDRGSTLGTLVNDIRIGGPSNRNELELEKGRAHRIIVGSPDSPFKFEVLLR